MTKKSNYLLSLFGALLLASPIQAQNLLPKPQQVMMGKGVFSTAGGVKVENQVGADAENIYTKAWNAKVNDAAKRVVKFTKLANASSPEAYKLHVAPDAIEISAASSEGFLRAWQTMEQLTTKKGIACCDIVDAPAYKWRGLMLDVSRHFFPISFLKKQIDVMSEYKFNRLHIHLTDAAGWRIESSVILDSITLQPGVRVSCGKTGMPMATSIWSRAARVPRVVTTLRMNSATW